MPWLISFHFPAKNSPKHKQTTEISLFFIKFPALAQNKYYIIGAKNTKMRRLHLCILADIYKGYIFLLSLVL